MKEAERKCNVTVHWRNYLRELTGEGECQLLWGNSEGRARGGVYPGLDVLSE